MNINMSSIMSKTKAFSESPEGKRRMKACLEKYEKEGRASTGAGDKLITEKMMWEAVSKFIHVMKTAAADYDLPESVMAHINGIESSGYITKLPNNEGYEIHLSFSGDLHRDSLDNDLGYEGVDNIVALFNNGYHAKNYVFGWWNGHKATGDGVLRSGVGSDFAYIRSKKEREALRFIQQAVMDFNAGYGAKYGVIAVESTIYR